jgi:hypothetical protein
VKDVQVTAKLRIKSLNHEGSWADYPIPVGHSGAMDYLERNSAPRLQIHKMEREHLDLLARHLEINNPETLSTGDLVAQLSLERLLAVGSQEKGSEPHVRVIVSGAHPYTGARRAKIRTYVQSAIAEGEFSSGDGRRGLAIKPSSNHSEAGSVK